MQVLRYAAFTDDPAAGNPAGVVLDAEGAGATEMLAVAADVGYSETAFLTSAASESSASESAQVEPSENSFAVRYFSPEAEVPFCGHATVAAAVAVAEQSGFGALRLQTAVGEVPVEVRRQDGKLEATLTSVTPRTAELAAEDRQELLAALGWQDHELDPALPPRVGYAGAWHPIIAVRTRTRLAELDYDFARLRALMARRDWTTVQLIWRESTTQFHSRNPFPPGGVIEDPVTGAAAAALGGYLRELGLVELPAEVTIVQGEDLGRPGSVRVEIPVDPSSGIRIGGAAVRIPDRGEPRGPRSGG